MPTDSVVHQLAIRVSNRLRDERLMLVTAESCTGGMVATAITDISGSSGWFERGFVTYSNQAKSEMIGVPAELIEKHGAVSEQVARAMAEGALARFGTDVAVSTGWTDRQLDFLPQSPHPSQMRSLITTRWLGVGYLPRLRLRRFSAAQC